MIYAKEMRENVVRPMFWQMIDWKIGFEHDFQVNVGKSGKFATEFLDRKCYNKILQTYANADIDKNWAALFLMTKIFRNEQIKIGQKLGFLITIEEADHSINYLFRIKAL